MGIRAGELNKRVTLQRETSPPDEGGGAYEDNWTDVAEMWAAIEPLSGSERFAAQQTQSGLTTRVKIRYRTGVIPQQRFLYGSRAFHIVQPPINEREKGESLVCLCEERNV